MPPCDPGYDGVYVLHQSSVIWEYWKNNGQMYMLITDFISEHLLHKKGLLQKKHFYALNIQSGNQRL